MWNYLRVRGEYEHARIPRCYQGELPPRARRILLYAAAGMGASGTTSACAENTAISSIACLRSRNYLRVRGEYLIDGRIWVTLSELPPRARRIRVGAVSAVGIDGTTSACAENTCLASRQWRPRWNYLRVRGEYKPGVFLYAPIMELPPRARRILNLSSIGIVRQGTTSACAENTSQSLPAYQ